MLYYWVFQFSSALQLLAHSLFDEIIYDLDEKRIVGFKVKPWAEPFLQLRAALLEGEWDGETKNRFDSDSL